MITVNLVFINSDVNSFGAKLINSFAFSHEHDLKLASLWVVVDKLSKFLIHWIVLNWDVNCNSLFELNDVVLECFYLDLGVFQLLQQFKGCLIGFVCFLFLLK